MSFDIAIRKTHGDCTLDFRLQSNKSIVAIVGQSGIGKTTALNCIAGLLRPDSGHITVGGRALFDAEADCDIPPDQRRCGYVFQDSRLFPHMSVAANLSYGIPQSEPSAGSMSLEAVTALLDIEPLLSRKPANLSGGEVRRVAIGRALLSNPDFLLLDEPLASLDGERGEHILQAIERLRDEHAIPILYVSHDRKEVARLTNTLIALD